MIHRSSFRIQHFSIQSMGALFGVDLRTISEHLRNIFAGNELQENSVVRKFRNTASDGKRNKMMKAECGMMKETNEPTAILVTIAKTLKSRRIK